MSDTEYVAIVRNCVVHAEGNGQVVVMVATGTRCDFHQLTLEQARTLSLELVNYADLAEQANNPEQDDSTRIAGIQTHYRHAPF
jgi:hypothetical protein